MHSGKLNSTQLNCTELDRSVEFSSVFRCALNRRRAAPTVAGSWQSRPGDTAVASRRSSSPVVVQRQTLHWLADSRESASIVKNLRRPPISSPNRRGSSQVQYTAGNWTERNSSVEFSSVFRCALGFSNCCGIAAGKKKHLKNSGR